MIILLSYFETTLFQSKIVDDFFFFFVGKNITICAALVHTTIWLNLIREPNVKDLILTFVLPFQYGDDSQTLSTPNFEWYWFG